MTENPKEYYEKKPGYEVKSGTVDAAGKKIDYAVFTDNGQGFEYTQEGNKFDTCDKTSMEVCGNQTKEQEPAKVIFAENGNIQLEAPNGEIVLKARSIRIVAMDGSGEVTINSAKNFSVQSPVQNYRGTYSNTVMTSQTNIAALAVGTRGEVQNSATSGSEDTEGSLLTQLLKLSQQFKDWISSCVGG